MQININGTPYDVPSDLQSFTLGQFIEYWDQYGRNHHNRIQALLQEDMPADPFDRELDLLDLDLQEAIGWYSYFTGFDFSDVDGVQADELMKEYNMIRTLIRQSEEEQVPPGEQVIEWNNEKWVISDYKITPSSHFIFNELLTSKEITRQIYAIGKGRWEALPYLCAVFLRKRNEPFTEWLTMEESGRVKMMHELPMAHAMQVAFFLTISVLTWSSISVSSKEVAEASPK